MTTLGARAFSSSRPAVWLTMLFIASRICVFVFLSGRYTDLGVHAGYVRQIDAGRVPFRDFFPEYPPLVFLVTYLPAIFDPSLKSYDPIFRTVCLLVDCGIWLLVLKANLGPRCAKRKIAEAPSPQPSPVKGEGAAGTWNCLLYIFGTTALGPLLYDRIDIILGALLLIAVISVLRGRNGPANFAIGTGIAFKLIPVVVAPAMFAVQFRKNARRVWRTALALALPTVLSFDVMAVFGGWRFDKLFEYHLQRGIQIESVPASIEMVLMMFGVSGKVDYTFRSHNVTTAYAGGLMTVATGLLALMVVGSAIVPFRRRMNPRSTALLIAAVLCGSLVLSKVLSPQFFLFLLPVLVVIPVPRGRWEAIANWTLIAAIYGLTGLIFPWFYDDLIGLKLAAVWMVMLRNELLLVLAVSLAYRAWKASAAREPTLAASAKDAGI